MTQEEQVTDDQCIQESQREAHDEGTRQGSYQSLSALGVLLAFEESSESYFRNTPFLSVLLPDPLGLDGQEIFLEHLEFLNPFPGA